MYKGLSLVAAYAPISAAPQRERGAFWEQLSTVLRAVPGDDILGVGGDFNAHIPANLHEEWPRVAGRFGSVRTSRGGRELLQWSAQHGLAIMDTYFDQPMRHPLTWRHPARRTGHIRGNCFRCVDRVKTVHEGRRAGGGGGTRGSIGGNSLAITGKIIQICCRWKCSVFAVSFLGDARAATA